MCGLERQDLLPLYGDFRFAAARERSTATRIPIHILTEVVGAVFRRQSSG
jgi:hypothetical protein